MKTTAIVLAAGSGKRMGTAVKKQFLNIGGRPVLYYSLYAFEKSSHIDEIILVVSPDDMGDVGMMISEWGLHKIKSIVPGGKERYNSVYNGLLAADGSDFVFIHDGARPFINEELIEKCMTELEKCEGCVLGVKSKDTVKIAGTDGFIADSPDRNFVWNVQTPQCFEYTSILKAYTLLDEAEKKHEIGDISITDDTFVAEHFAGVRVKLVEGSYSNIKITTPDDLPLAEKILESICEIQ